jgi:hypothetical protein
MLRPTLRGPLAVVLLLAALGCSADDNGSDATGTTAATATAPTTSSTGPDPSLEALLVRPGDLPPGFAPSDGIDDTITAFCANEDATAGLQATGRALAGYTRDPAGASVIHLVYRFRSGDAARFVQQAAAILGRCNGVPDAAGLAFTYGPASPQVEAALAGTDAHVARTGTSAGSGDLSIGLAVFRHGDLGHLVAVLGVRMPRAELDALAAAAATAAAP